MKTLKLKPHRDLEFDEAQRLATEEASQYINDPMVIGWLNRKTGKYFPDVECCGDECKAAWEIYAENRGGSVRVEVDEQYVFILREGI